MKQKKVDKIIISLESSFVYADTHKMIKDGAWYRVPTTDKALLKRVFPHASIRRAGEADVSNKDLDDCQGCILLKIDLPIIALDYIDNHATPADRLLLFNLTGSIKDRNDERSVATGAQ